MWKRKYLKLGTMPREIGDIQKNMETMENTGKANRYVISTGKYRDLCEEAYKIIGIKIK